MKLLPYINIFFAFSYAGTLPAQELNLVPNPGFEYNLSSTPNTGYNQVTKANYYLTYGWLQPTTATTDFWNSPECKVQIKEGGWVMHIPPAHTGKAQAGLLLNSHRQFSFGRKVYGEYLRTRLLEPLVAGKTYYFECYVMLSKQSGWSASNIGAFFSDEPYSMNGNHYFNLEPQLVFTDQHLLSARGEWKKLSGFFTAKGEEKYMTIGTFVYPGSCISEKKLPRTGQPGDKDLRQTGYYYADDFLLVEVDEEIKKEKAPEDHVTMLVDISNSMYQEKHIEALKNKVSEFISGQGHNTKITLVTFGSGVKMRVYAKQFSDTATWNKVIEEFGPSGSTNIARAMETGFEMADSLENIVGRNRIILFTDARFDINRKTQKTIRSHLDKTAQEFDLYQFGNYYNKKLDKAITKSGGEYHASSEKNVLQLLEEKKTCDCGDRFVRRLKWGSWRSIRFLGAATIAGVLLFIYITGK